MSGYYWLNATVLFVAAVLCCEMWYRRLEATLTAKLKLAEANVEYDGDEWTTVEDDDSGDGWKLN